MMGFMASEKEKDVEWGNRLRLLREEKGLTQKELAEDPDIDISLPTIQRYESGDEPSAKGIREIVKYFKCKKVWLLTGEGNKYINAGVPEPSAGPTYIKETAGPYPATRKGLIDPASSAPAEEFSIAEDLILAARVLESRTHYAASLHMNIRSFMGGVSAETTMSKCQDDLHRQGELIAQLQARLDERDRQDKVLREEIKKLKGSSGGSPPIALGMDHAAHTGTDDQAT
jgi:transcriptional regulator with XRE-family HTH domain